MRLHSYEFPLIEGKNWKEEALTKYDIPQLIKDIPEQFPPFCTTEESCLIKNLYKNSFIKNIKEDNIEEPIPNKKNNYCDICKKTFLDYLNI